MKEFSLLIITLIITGCTVGPDYRRPRFPVPAEFKEAKGWKIAEPQDHLISEQWWRIFNDPSLNKLEDRVKLNNQSLAQAEAQFRQAQGALQAAEAAYFPTITGTSLVNRFRAASGQSVAVSGVKYLFGIAVSVMWEPDLWGKVRRQVEAGQANAQASAATLQAMQLSMQASLAQNYFQLRIVDKLKDLFAKTCANYQRTLNIVENRYNAGVVAKSDVVQAEAQLQATRAQAIHLDIQRTQLEHATALLIGRTPAELSIPPQELTLQLPEIPITIPSQILERRPDIAAAERQMAAANAQIGVAKAAYYPTISLSASEGSQANILSNLLTNGARYWALGPAALALPLFDGGARGSQLEQARAAFDASAASYRQTVLVAFQEVEDNLAALRVLQEEMITQEKAVAAAEQAWQITLNQYKAGTVSFLNVLTAQSTILNTEQNLINLAQQRFNAAVLLIKALGGGWQSSKLPKPEQLDDRDRLKRFLPWP